MFFFNRSAIVFQHRFRLGNSILHSWQIDAYHLLQFGYKFVVFVRIGSIEIIVIQDFTDLFLRRLGDQKVFIEHGIPAVLFTSGITMNTNKVDDTASTLDYGVLRKRALLISRWLSLQ